MFELTKSCPASMIRENDILHFIGGFSRDLAWTAPHPYTDEISQKKQLRRKELRSASLLGEKAESRLDIATEGGEERCTATRVNPRTATPNHQTKTSKCQDAKSGLKRNTTSFGWLSEVFAKDILLIQCNYTYVLCNRTVQFKSSTAPILPVPNSRNSNIQKNF